MAVLLGLDWGEKRIGVAKSDEGGMIAEALATLSYETREGLLKQLKIIFQELGPEKVIVGFPETLQGKKGVAAQKVAEFVDWLKGRLAGEWILWDERFSTVEAERILLEADLSRRKRRGIRDRLAAQRILQSYLDSKKNV